MDMRSSWDLGFGSDGRSDDGRCCHKIWHERSATTNDKTPTLHHIDQAPHAISSISICPLARKSMPLAEKRCRIDKLFALSALFFLVFLVQRTTSFLPSILRKSPQTTRHISMGLTESLFQKDASENKKANRPTKEHPIDPQIRERWKRMCDEFEQAVLDPAYLHLPIRASTVNASLLYKSDFPERPGMMPGTHKHLGGAYDPSDGSIYGVPANSRAIMCIYPNKDKGGEYQLTTIPLPERIQKQKMKWLRGIISNGYLWAIPAWADSVLCVDLDAFWGRRALPEGQNDVVTLIPLPESHPKGMRWQWHGAGINHAKTAIYCVPSNAKNVLKVDVLTKTTSFIEIEYDAAKYPEFSLDCPNKWYGGITGDDGCVYGVPYRSSSVLRIDPSNDTAKLIGPNYGIAKYFWHGGILRHGKIYAHPSHSASVLMIDTRKENSGTISELPIHRASYDVDKTTNYKVRTFFVVI